METILDRLWDAGVVKGEIIACDATFIKAYSKRDPKDDSRGTLTLKPGLGELEKPISSAARGAIK